MWCTFVISLIPLILLHRLPNRLSEVIWGPLVPFATFAMLLVLRWWRRPSASDAVFDGGPRWPTIAALSTVVFFTGMVLGVAAIWALPWGGGLNIALFAVMGVAMPFIVVVARRYVLRWQGSPPTGERTTGVPWLKVWAWTAWVLAIPVVGFGLFFLHSFVSSTGPWNPATDEAVIVPLIWLGSLLLPLSGWILLRAARKASGAAIGHGPRPWASAADIDCGLSAEASTWVTSARWTARILGLLGFLFVLVFILPEGFPRFFGQPLTVQVELAATVQMLVGLLLGWRWPGWGGFLIVDGWIVFLVAERGWPPVPYTAFLIVAGLYAWSWWRERGQSKPFPLEGQAAINEAEWQDPKNWTGPRWLSLYFSKRDCRVWVPKQIPALGWTVNLGHPKGLACLLGLIVLLSLLPAITPHMFPGRYGPPFLPVKEVNLNDVDLILGQDALDLDNGRLLDQPKEMSRWSEQERTRWFIENGPDLFAHFAEGQFHLITPICNELKLTSLANDRWTTISAKGLTQALATGTSGLTEQQVKAVRQLLLPSDARLPLTFGFQTAVGNRGLLQITAFTDNPSGVKIRYKRMQCQQPETSMDTTASTLQFRLVATEGSSEPADLLSDPNGPSGQRQLCVLRQELMIAGRFSAAEVHEMVDSLNRAARSTESSWNLAGPQSPGSPAFATTYWSVVLAAKDRQVNRTRLLRYETL